MSPADRTTDVSTGRQHTAAQRAYERIRRAIISAELDEGEPVREDAWASELGMSRTPVREALRRLASDGLVEVLPARGARVVVRSAEELEDHFRLRALLEGHAAEQAAGIDDELLAERIAVLKEVQKRMEVTAQEDGAEARRETGRLDLELHRGIVALTRRRYLIAAHERLAAVPTQYHSMLRYTRAQLRDRFRQHRDILAAIEVRDPALAGALMRAHVLSAWHMRTAEQRENG